MSQKYKRLVKARTSTQESAGRCLPYAQSFYGAPVMYDSATDAGRATKHKHYDRNIPDGALLWFDHWGTYYKYSKGTWEYDNFGHVVIKHGGKLYTSPGVGYGYEVWDSIAQIESRFSSRYRYWSEDINGLRVIEPIQEDWEDTMKTFSGKTAVTSQTLKPGVESRLKINDKGDVSVAFGPGDIVGLAASVRLEGTPGKRVQITLYREEWSATKGDFNSQKLSGARAVFDSLGLAEVVVAGSGYLKKQHRVRVAVHPAENAGVTTVKDYRWNGYNRPA